MQNLRDVRHRILDIPDSTQVSATTFDLTDDSIVCAFGPIAGDPLLSLKRLRTEHKGYQDLEQIAAWDAVCPRPDLDHDSIIDIHHFSDDQIIVLALAGGDIVLVREAAAPGEDAVEIVGSVDDGIAAAAWSPDEEILLLATCSNSLLWMTRQFDNTASATLSIKDVKVSNHVSVGWGKVETQFKGRGARALRDPTLPEHVDVGTLSDKDTGKTSISWRGDGQYVALNSILDTEQQRRIIRVFTREGALESVSEAVDGMEDALAWKPTGQLIASVQRFVDRAQVIFFEKNGLRHGEFDLRIGQEDLYIAPITLAWNTDSSVLSVSYGDKIQLWASSNYHWYLKQEIRCGVPGISPSRAVWHPEKPLTLSCSAPQRVYTVQYTSAYTVGPTSAPHDNGLIATIDGRRLAVTPLRYANIPPPLSFDELELQFVAVDVAFDPIRQRLAVLHHRTIAIYDYDYDSRPAKKAKLTYTRDLHLDMPELSVARQIAVDKYGAVSVVCAASLADEDVLLSWSDENTEALSEKQATTTSCFTTTGTGQLALLNSSGRLIGNKTRKSDTHNAISFSGQAADTSFSTLPKGCVEAQIWDVGEHCVSFGRTATGALHACSALQQLKIPGCTSFAVTTSYLIFTTSQHLLKFVHLGDGQLDIPLDEPEKDERCRSIERGAKIVTVMPSIFALVLQMPRGNLETIYPRALVLAGIRRSLLDRDYKKAFLICRSQRVDMNILYDYAPDALLADVDLFIKQVKKIEYIDLFLSSLAEEDVTKTLYKDTAAVESSDAAIANNAKTVVIDALDARTNTKVNTICDAFLLSLRKLGPECLQSIITAHVSKNPPDLEAGLKLISELRTQSDENTIEQAIDHICFLCDVNRLYDTALGLYDLEVTLLVAQKSQKDPREYLPYVQGLRELNIDRQRFTIDNDLKRYSKALSSLHVLNEFDELVKYVDRHELYAQALELYRHDKIRLHQLTRLHADYLSSRNRYCDAGIAYEFVGDYHAAYEAYRAANMWRESLVAAALAPVDTTELRDLAQALSDSLSESKEYASAATIHLDYLGDLAGAIKLQCKAYNFSEAMRLAVSRGTSALFEQAVDPGLVECSGLMTELLAEMKTQLHAQIPRLRELRKKKLEEPMAYLDAGENENNDFPDNISIAPTDASTSGGTFMTRYTNRSDGTIATNATRKTSKGRRREERKRARGKKGTVYEEEYLVNSITRLIERLNETGPDVSRLVQGLMRRSMRERAVAVENAVIEVEQICREHMAEVYEQTSPSLQSTQQDLSATQAKPAGGQGVLWETLNTSQKADAPILKNITRLSLLSS